MGTDTRRDSPRRWRSRNVTTNASTRPSCIA